MKMTRMKSFVKKWQSLAKVGKVHTFNGSYSTDMENDENEEEDLEEEAHDQSELDSAGAWNERVRRERESGANASSSSRTLNAVPEGFAAVFVGKARRQYVVHARHLHHPLFKALQQRSENSGINQSLGLTLGCEVVLFEHLLWMLDSDDPALRTDSIHELAELYMPSDGSSVLHLLQHD